MFGPAIDQHSAAVKKCEGSIRTGIRVCRAQSVVSGSTLRIGSRHFSQSVFLHVKWPARNLSIIYITCTYICNGALMAPCIMAWREAHGKDSLDCPLQAGLACRFFHGRPGVGTLVQISRCIKWNSFFMFVNLLFLTEKIKKKIRKIHEEVTKLQASKLSKSANFVRIFSQSNGDQKMSKHGC